MTVDTIEKRPLAKAPTAKETAPRNVRKAARAGEDRRIVRSKRARRNALIELMEEEGYVVTNGNTGSVLHVDDAIYARISDELTHDMVLSFVRAAKENGLPFPRVVALIGELWEDG